MGDVDGVVDVDDVQNAGDSAGVHDVGDEDGAGGGAPRRRKWNTTDEVPRRGNVAPKRQVYENDRQEEGVSRWCSNYVPGKNRCVALRAKKR